jgi:hypothetical protein
MGAPASTYWSPPVLRIAGDSSAKNIKYDPKAPAYAKAKIETVGKKPFIASASWKESAEWKAPVNLLALADPKSGAIAGTWTRDEQGALKCSKVNGGRLAIDYKLPAKYDIKAVFERTDGNSDATLILSHNKHYFVWQMGAEQNKHFDLAQVGGKKFEGNPTLVTSGNCLKNNERYTTVVEVRKDRVSAYLNGKLITEWTPDMGELGISPTWKLPDGKSIGIGAFQSEVTFHSLEIVER